jgi:hypothetical protein
MDGHLNDKSGQFIRSRGMKFPKHPDFIKGRVRK